MKTRKFLSIAFSALAFSINLHAQPFDFQWANRAGGSGHDHGQHIARDGSGNVYVTGTFLSTTITFGSITLTKAVDNFTDIFLVKYDAGGNVLWAKSAGGGANDDQANGIATDENGNVFLTGGFRSDSITFGSITLYNTNFQDIFTVKYDPNGNAVWAKSAGSMGANSVEQGNAIAIDVSGNVYVSGYFRGNSITFGSTTLTNAGQKDIFIVKYDANGIVTWAKREGAQSGGDVGVGLAIDGSGDFYLTGTFYSGTITFGSTTLTKIGSGAQTDIFLVKYDAAGNVLWAKSAGNGQFDEPTGMTIDAGGNVYITGYFEILPITFGSTILPNSGSSDVFVAKYDPNGNVLWAKSAGIAYGEEATDIDTDASGNAYITGYFGPTITFGTITLTGTQDIDIFIVKYDLDGNVVWARSVGGQFEDQGNGICTDGNNNLYVTGAFRSPSIAFGSNNLNSAGNHDVFVAKLNLLTGIDEPIFSEDLTIFPNPFYDRTNLQMAEPLDNATITLTNGLGQVVKKIENVRGKTVTLYRDKLIAGVYFLQVTQDKEVLVFRKMILLE